MQPDAFDVLGFAHICEPHRKTSDCIVRRETARKRMVTQLKGLHQQMRLLRLRSQWQP